MDSAFINLSFLPADLHLVQTQDGFVITMGGQEIHRTRSQQAALGKYHWLRAKLEKKYAAHEPTPEEKKELLLKQVAESVFENERFVAKPSPVFRLSPDALLEIELALSAYCSVVEQSGLTLSAQCDYIAKADNFVRWTKGEFVPGSRVLPMRPKEKRGPAGLTRKPRRNHSS
jgi:hypothetical protein